MANPEVAILVSAKDNASSTLQKVNADLKTAKKEADKTKEAWDALGKAAMGISAGAAGAIALVESNKELNTSLSLTGTTLGLTRSQMQDLARATADAGFPIAEVAATFDVLTKAGIRDTDVLQDSAKAFDSLADATGGSADALAATLVPAFKALGKEIPKTADEMDSLTWLTKNTQVTIDDFGSAMNYVAAYGQDLGVELDDMVGIMAALEAKGITGAAVTKVFRTAITQAKDGTVSLNDALGLTQDEIDNYKTQMEGATGITEDYAEAAESNLTIMDKAKNVFQEAGLKLSAFLEPMQPLLAALTALAPAIMAIKAAKEAWTVAQTALNVVLNANPIGLIVLAIAALIAIVVVIIKNWEPIKAFFQGVWDAIKGAFETAINAIKGVVETVFNAISGFIQTIWGGIQSFFQTVWNAIYAVVEPVITAIKSLVEAKFNEVKTVVETIWNAIKAVIDGVWEAIKMAVAIAAAIIYAVIKAVWDPIKPYAEALWNATKVVVATALNAIKSAVETVFNAIKGVVITVWNAVKGVFTTVWDAIKGVFNTALAAIKGVLDTAWNAIKGNVTAAWSAIRGAFQSVWDGIKSVFSSAWEGIKSVWNSASSFFGGIVSSIASKFSGVIDAITSPFRTAFNSIKSLANAIIGGLNSISFTVPDFPGIPHRGETIGIHIPYLAKGGILTGPSLISDLLTGKPLAVAGEAGPEAVVPMSAMRGGGGGTVLNTTVVLNVDHLWGDKEGARKLLDYLLPEIRDKQRLALGKAQW